MPHSSGSQKGPPRIWTNLKWSRIRHWGSRRATTKSLGVLRQSRDWGPPTVLATVICKRPPTYNHPGHLHHHPPPHSPEGSYPLARRLLRARMIEEIVQSQAPIKVYVKNFILLFFNYQLKLFKFVILRFNCHSNCKFVSCFADMGLSFVS